MRECIREVVWGNRGTARLVRDDRVCVAGKTGTAFPVENGVYNKAKRRYAFAGFFPYENPQYSCMALVLSGGGNSANRTSGQVVKNMAVKMYSRGMLNNASTYTAERADTKPTLYASDRENPMKIFNAIGVKGIRAIKKPEPTALGTIPDVRGYELPTAVRKLEALGVNVRITGAGHVVAQSMQPGARYRRGDNITLTLRN